MRAKSLAAAEAALRAHALAKPSATEHFPWGERAIKVNGKVFLFMSGGPGQLSLSIKLPETSAMALMLPFAMPTGYGLGKAGWVSARFARGEAPPVELLCAWIDESYHAIAPAKLAALARGAAPQEAGRAVRSASRPKPRARTKPAAKTRANAAAKPRSSSPSKPRANAAPKTAS